MKFLLFAVFSVCVFYTTAAETEYSFFAEEEEYTDLRLLLANQTDEDKKCMKPGLLCTNCNTLVNCVQGENGDYEKHPVQTCSSGQTCFRDHCTTDVNPVCVTDYKFDCTATGMFPDPFNCRKYHHCVVKQTATNDIEIVSGSIGITTLLCDRYHSYDPISSYCKGNITDGCPDDLYPVPICKTSGQTGPLTNKSIYYVCVVTGINTLVPKLYMCPHGTIFNNSRCV